MAEPLLQTRNLCKDFPGGRVLHDISVDIGTGEILGLIGENGAGKSTFVKILAGSCEPTAGEIRFAGQTVHARTPRAAKRIGICLLPQEFNLIATLSVCENVFLGNELRKWGGAVVDQAAMRERTAALLRDLRTSVAPDARLTDLGVAEKQMVEIAKALVHESKLLIMDEPTTVLTQNEVAVLFALLRQLRDRGVSIIFISHKLHEVKAVCDRVMILRDGHLVGVEPVAALDEAAMARRMVGRELSQVYPAKPVPGSGVALRVENLHDAAFLREVSFELRQGEILGLGGLAGAGRTELAEALIGVRPKSGGRVWVDGQEVSIRCPGDAVRHGITYLPEDRQGAGILTAFDVTSNITLESLSRYARILVRRRSEETAAAGYVERFRIKTQSLSTRLEFLSGGNQQKVSLAKALDPRPRILIVDEPTRGIDINARSDIYGFLCSLARSGLACLVISSEMEELIGLCHRVLVMRAGRMVGELTGTHVNEQEIIYHATGVKG